MPRKNLTAKFVENVQAPKSGQVDFYDTGKPGFGLRVSYGGAKGWFMMRRLDGRMRRWKLGRADNPKAGDYLTLKKAREKASEWSTDIEDGIDPTIQADAEPESEDTRANAGTFGSLVETYFADETPKIDSGRAVEAIIRRELLPHWRTRPLSEITGKDAIRRVDAVKRRGTPYAANRLVEVIKRLFTYAVEKMELTQSPMVSIKKPAKKIARDRTLKEQEIKDLWTAWNSMGFPFGQFMQLLLLTAARRDEVAGMRWSELNLDAATWTIPRERTKSERANIVHLSPVALAALSAVPRTMAQFVFPTQRGNTYLSGFSKAKARADTLSGVTDWRIHDLRRTAVTGMAELNVPPHVVEKILNHSSGEISGVAAVYNRFEYLEERADALDLWGQRIETIVAPGPENVVSIRR